MELKNKIIALLGVTLALALSACKDDVTTPNYTVGEAINAISLRAGISEGGAGLTTRAVDDEHSGTSYGGQHTNFSSEDATQLRLRVDGKWHSTPVSKPTTASIGDPTGNGNMHNEVSFSTTSDPVEQLYWDDYGTADPDNTAGRSAGLTIYGVAVDGVATAPTVSDWSNLSWTLSSNQSATGVWGKEDLLISNNIQSGKDGTYKFDSYLADLKNSTNTSSNLLVFTHAMSKITVNLIAGEGFPTTGVGATAKRFAAEPEVVLTSNLYNQSGIAEWANTKYSVNVMTGAIVTASNTPLAITTKTTKTNDPTVTVVKEALVMPGSAFGDAVDGVYPQVLSILSDGNRYYVTSEEMRKAIATAIGESRHTGYTTEAGKNYVFKIIVNKTGIDVTATIKNWDNINAASETPFINFSQCYGETGNDFGKGFTLYRSTSVTGSYISGITEGNTSDVSYDAGKYTMSNQLYWPDHSTHYFFRGVWPQVNTSNGPATGKVKANTIDIENVAYTDNTYPSDLMIGMPRKSDGSLDEHCKSTHNVDGICATDAADGATHANEGLIHLNFQYVMSQVEVVLQSVIGDAAVKVDENTVVELVNVYKTGNVQLSDGLVTPTGDKVNYTLNLVTGTGNKLKRHSAIVPQELTFTEKGATANLRFKITVTNDNGTQDVYYTDINPILKTGSLTDKVAANGKWESGYHYKYVLTLSKTGINVSATITDWEVVNASDDIWF